MNDKTGRTLRIIAIIFMGLTAAMNILGGIGTVCAAFLTKQFPPMWALLEYQWLYQSLMITTIIVGIAGVWATIVLIRGRATAYRNALIVLVIGSVLGAIQYYASMTLRGSATPANMKFFINALTLLFFLLLKLPGLRDRVDFTKPGDEETQAATVGLTAVVTGLFVLTTSIWAGPSHSIEGENWVLVLQGQLVATGILLTIVGVRSLLRRRTLTHTETAPTSKG
jgi:hypothetical protein